MNIGRNDPCPCGSGLKYKKCCIKAGPGHAQPDKSNRKCTPRFRFESGTYGGRGRQYMPAALCYEQFAPGQWRDYYCLVNPVFKFDEEDDAGALAAADLNEAFTLKGIKGDQAVAECLSSKGYIDVNGFKRAID